MAGSMPDITPSKVSDFLLLESRERGELLTNLKLQKLLFYADAWSMVLRNEELFDERFQAWIHGPVLVSQYHRFKGCQWRPISENIQKPKLPKGVPSHLRDIVDVFGTETAVALELMTHREQPWISARKDCSPTATCKNYISKEVTKAFYKAM